MHVPKNQRSDQDLSIALFSSVRERRLWAWTLVAVVGIYATLGLAQTLAATLRDRGLISDASWFGLFLAGAAIVVQGLKMRPRGIEIGVVAVMAGRECGAGLGASGRQVSPLIVVR